MADLDAILAQVRTLSLLTVGDISDADVTVFINEGYNDLSSLFEWPWLQAQATATITADTAAVTPPSGWAKIRAVMLDGESGRLRQIQDIKAWERWGDDVPSGTPETYYMFGETLYVQPIPTANTDLRIYYTTTPTLLSAGADLPEWDAQFHTVLADFALKRVWEREEDLTKARSHEAAYNRTVNAMGRYYLNRSDDQPVVFGESPDHAQRRRGPDNQPWFAI